VRGWPEIKVEAKPTQEGGVQFEITNPGYPIDAEDQKKLFTLFPQFAGRTDATQHSLGLFVVSEIAKAHGGSVSFEREGEQNKFTLVLMPKKD
jgi:signal transduction histidine kinase